MMREMNLYRDVFLGLTEALCVFDADGRFLVINPAAERLLGCTSEEFTKKRFDDVFHVLQPEGTSFEDRMNTQIRFPSFHAHAGSVAEQVRCLRKDNVADIITIRFNALYAGSKAQGWIAAIREGERPFAQEPARDFAAMKSLSGILPICSACKRIRDTGGWVEVEHYIALRTDAEFSHSICPGCAKKLYPSYFEKEAAEETASLREKRTFKRHSFATPIEYMLPGDDSPSVHRGIMIDISSLGFGGYFWNDVRIGQEIILKTRLPVAFRAAIICWVQKNDDMFFRTGLKFSPHAPL